MSEPLPPSVFNAAKRGNVDFISSFFAENSEYNINSVGPVRERAVVRLHD
jgi:hypothetical protein